MADGPGVRVDIEMSPVVAVDDAEELAVAVGLLVWLPSPWPVSCGVPFFVVVGLRPDRRPSGPFGTSRIHGLAGEGAMRKMTSLHDGAEIVTYNLTVLLADVKVILSGRGMSAHELTGIGGTLTLIGPTNEV